MSESIDVFGARDEPIARQFQGRLRLTRRLLIGSALSSPLIGYSSLAREADARAKAPWKLRIDLTADGKQLTVVETPHASSAGVTPIVWKVPSLAFGPKAWFDMQRPSQPESVTAVADEREVDQERRIIVRAVSYGNRSGVTITFIFRRAFSAKEFRRWTLAYHTDLWLGSNGASAPPVESRPVDFCSFIDADEPESSSPSEDIAVGRIGTTFGVIFSRQMSITPAGASVCRTSLDRHLEWHMTAMPVHPDGLGLPAFGPRIRLNDLHLAWRRDCVTEEVFLSARSSAALAPSDARVGSTKLVCLVLGDINARHVMVTTGSANRWPLEARIGPSPLRPSKVQSVIAMRLGEGAVGMYEGRRLSCGRLPARDLILSATYSISGVSRRVLWGEAVETPQATGEPAVTASIESPIGKLMITAAVFNKAIASAEMPKGSAASRGTDCNDEEPGPVNAVKRLFQIANGDQSGAPGSTLFVVDDADGEAKRPVLRQFSANVALRAASVSPPDINFSRLRFDNSDLRLYFDDGKELDRDGRSPYPQPLTSSHVWLGQIEDVRGESLAVLDLSNARLTCARDADLMKLGLRFKDLRLSFPSGKGQPSIVPAREDCRLEHTSDGQTFDSRPIIVADFDSQHVFEECILWPEPLGLPDIEIPPGSSASPALSGDRVSVIRELESLKELDKRVDFRGRVRDAKLGSGYATDEQKKAFSDFADEFKGQAAASGLPQDQSIYIGPFALDPDAMAIARRVQGDRQTAVVLSTIDDMLKRVVGTIWMLLSGDSSHPKFLQDVDSTVPPVGSAGSTTAVGEQLRYSLRNELLLEQQEPLYSLFREHWRGQVVEAKGRVGGGEAGRQRARTDAIGKFLGDPPSPWLDEYLAGPNRPGAMKVAVDEQRYGQLESEIKRSFARLISGKGPLPKDGLVGARLSGGSRLAFRINCEPVAGLDADEAGLAPRTYSPAERAGGANPRYPAIPFTFDALTDWSRHEPAVTRRAQRLFDALPSGVVPVIGNRAANVSDLDMLRFQGFQPGSATGAQRMSDVRASLKVVPTSFETAIEIPARLILSTAQDAVWRTPRRMPADLGLPTLASCSSQVDADGAAVLKAGQARVGHPVHLWSARLSTVDSAPGLRAVSSPDLRPMGLDGYRKEDGPRLPGHGAPPRGPWAPWFIGPEQLESGTVSTKEVWSATQSAASPATPEPADCDKAPELPEWNLFRALCMRLKAWIKIPSESYTFYRTSLDAFDRHQLVLLTSAFGLPVTGKRVGVGADGLHAGSLVSNSGQVEPSAYALSDGRSDQAIHRPIPLSVQELSLAALGGSLLHDTTFKPSAGADDYRGRKIFEGFSIERYQHEIVLGRDIRVEVVYKGYLLPLGHRASFVKLTERMFLLTEGGIKALLRQRFFIRVASPKKEYPAIGQPHEGRMWCGKVVTIITVRTPDLLDPAFPLGTPQSSTNPEALNGRVDLDSNAGIAFWPRTDITPRGLLRFEVDIDGAKLRMPLMFLDNIAATNRASLAVAASHYNGTRSFTDARGELAKAWPIEAEARRQVSLNGQPLAFAAAGQPGDTSYPVERLEVQVHGRDTATSGTWAGNLISFETSGALEGADQPPFYPRLFMAEIRLSRAERFTGAGKPMRAVAQYDGHYVRYGFPQHGARNETMPANVVSNDAEVFLNFERAVQLGMGSSGDRSAGVGRPESLLVAVSRKHGPLGGPGDRGEDVVWDLHPFGGETATAKLLDTSLTPAELSPVTKNRQGLASLVRYLSWSGQGTADVQGKDQLAPPVGVPEEVKDKGTSALERLKVLQSYFSGEAKILGAITLKDFLMLLDFEQLDFPALREVSEYGSSLSKTLDNSLSGVLNDIRTRVLAPLAQVLERLQREWTRLDAALVEKQRLLLARAVDKVTSTADNKSKTDTETLRLAKIYPEIDTGLGKVQAAVAAAAAVDRVEDLPATLATLYESAVQFIRALANIASHPVERLETAVFDSLLAEVSKIKAQVGQVANNLPLVSLVQRLMLMSSSDLATWILDALDPDPSPVLDTLQSGLAAVGFPTSYPSESWATAIFGFGLEPPRPRDLVRAWLEPNATVPPDLEKELAKIGGDLREELTHGAKAGLRKLLEAVFEHQLKQAEPFRVDAPWIRDKLAVAYKELFDDPKGTARASDRVRDAVKKSNLPNSLAEHVAERLARYQRALQAKANTVATIALANDPDLALAVASIRRVIESVDRVRRLVDAVKSGEPKEFLGKAASVLQDIFGVDVQQLGKSVSSAAAAYLDQGLLAAASKLQPGAPADHVKFQKEIEACRRYRAGAANALPLVVQGDVTSSTQLLSRLAVGISTLEQARGDLKSMSTGLTQFKGQSNDWAGHGTELKSFHESLERLLVNEGGDDQSLLTDLKLLYCEIVDAMVTLRAISSMAAEAQSSADPARAIFEQASLQSRSLQTAGRDVALRVSHIVVRLSEFIATNPGYVGTAAVLASTGDYVASGFGASSAAIKMYFVPLRDRLAIQEKAVVASIAATLEGAVALLANVGQATIDSVGQLRKVLTDSLQSLADLNVAVEPERTRLEGDLRNLELAISRLLTLVAPPPTDTIRSLLTAPIAGRKVSDYFALGSKDGYEASVAELRTAELRVAGSWFQLLKRLSGAPDLLRQKLEGVLSGTVFGQGRVFDVVSTTYKTLVEARNTAFGALAQSPVTSKLAKALQAPPDKAYADVACAPAVIVAGIECDLLLQESIVAERMAKIPVPTPPASLLAATDRTNLALFLGAWGNETSAPQVILKAVSDIAVSLVKGDLLAIVDFGTFRDQLEDAIADLIPIRTTLSYDFASSVKHEPPTSSIFQPSLGCEFGIHVRAVTDLREPEKSTFRASGGIGPFKVKLVGGLIDAIELRFRGAEFEMQAGSKPRFDVAYDDFKILDSLAFVKQLQPFLSPKDGNGVFVQPLAGRPGIEAGFGFNLSSIGLGAASFFNIILNVSAELPFDNSTALFRVGLGRRLSPFSMSVLPFCGSGFFAIICGADGIKGFEASFEYGAGGSLTFGPMVAQCRIQLGFYIQTLEIDGRHITSISGTFFAGGSANIWIFSFSTSLSVRLGQQRGGEMHGEAVFSFSFSLGIAKYNYSVKAVHTEQPIGSGGQKSSPQGAKGSDHASAAGYDEMEPIVLAAADTGTRSDAGNGIGGRAATKARNAKRAACRRDDPDTLSQRDWAAYRNYFDASLVTRLSSLGG